MKADLRQKYLIKRDSLPVKRVEEASEALNGFFKRSRFSAYESVMLYKSFGKEISVDGLIPFLQERGAAIYVPVVIGRHDMEAVEINGSTVFKNDPFGIPTPVERVPADPENIGLILVPGVVFDEKGGRIGHGAGYYDRFLKRAAKAVRIGVAYEFQVIPEITCLDGQDVPMDHIITEKGIRNCR